MKNTYKLTLLAGAVTCSLFGLVAVSNGAPHSINEITAPLAAIETVNLKLTGLK